MPLPLAQLQALEALRRSRVIVYIAGGNNPKGLDSEDVPIFYECLRHIGKSARLDCVLHTAGGSVSAARRISLLLRDFAEHVSILVPYKARSAGTLLCLGADEIVMGPLGELGPLDPSLGSAAQGSSNLPLQISAEDIRAFQFMAESWFGMNTPEQRTKVFEAMVQRFFPTTLSGFFRAEQYVHKAGEELLRDHLPHATFERRREIIDKLTRDYPEHSHSITCTGAAALGLNAKRASQEAEPLLWDILQGTFAFQTATDARIGRGDRTCGVLFGRQFAAQYLRSSVALPEEAKSNPSDKAIPKSRKAATGTWEIFSHDTAA